MATAWTAIHVSGFDPRLFRYNPNLWRWTMPKFAYSVLMFDTQGRFPHVHRMGVRDGESRDALLQDLMEEWAEPEWTEPEFVLYEIGEATPLTYNQVMAAIDNPEADPNWQTVGKQVLEQMGLKQTPVNPNLRAVMVPTFVIFDPTELDLESDEDGPPNVTLETVKDYLREVAIVDWKEYETDTIGIQSINFHVDDVVELTPDQVVALVRTPRPTGE